MSTMSQEELALLEKTIKLRERMLDHITNTEALPTKPREVDSVVNLIESLDRSIFGKAKIKIDDANSKTQEENKEVLRSFLLGMHKGEISRQDPPVQVSEYSPPVFESRGTEVSEGEVYIGDDKPDMSILKDL